MLAAILFPVFANAVKDSHRAASISNLRQCSIALMNYCNDYDGSTSMPSYDAAVQLLSNMPTCDPGDTWRSNCSARPLGAPMVGSYAYVRGIPTYTSQQAWLYNIDTTNNPAILASVFYANNIPAPFSGDMPNIQDCFPSVQRCELPDRALLMRLDGSVDFKKRGYGRRNTTSIMQWSILFNLGYPL